MELTYTQQGDYLIPNLTLPEKEYPALGKYGMLRKTYLKNHRKALFTMLQTRDTLWEHLAETDKTANEMMESLTSKMAKERGVTEALKAQDQMRWVQEMENIRNAAEEVVLTEVVYA